MTSIERYPLGAFCWFDLFTPDLARSKQFYNTALGWESDDQPSGGGPCTKFLTDGEVVVGGGEMSADMLVGRHASRHG